MPNMEMLINNDKNLDRVLNCFSKLGKFSIQADLQCFLIFSEIIKVASSYHTWHLGRSLLISCSLSDAPMFFKVIFSACKLIID